MGLLSIDLNIGSCVDIFFVENLYNYHHLYAL